MDRRGGGGGGGPGFNRRGMPKSLAGPAAEFMPQNIRLAFIPRPPLEYKPPLRQYTPDGELRRPSGSRSFLSGVGAQVLTHTQELAQRSAQTDVQEAAPTASTEEGMQLVESAPDDAGDAPAAAAAVPPAPIEKLKEHIASSVPPAVEDAAARKRARRAAHAHAHTQLLAERAADWSPRSDPHATSDPYRTLFVSRIAFETTARRLERELAEFGKITKVVLVRRRGAGEDAPDEAAPSRGYAFVEFEREEDMMRAYKGADGRRIDGRRILVDVERGRTVKDWKPRRLGGGLGDTRKTVPRKIRKKDTWVRPSLVDYWALTLETKAERDAAQQAAMDAAAASNAVRFASMGTRGVPGYSARFEDRYRAYMSAREGGQNKTAGGDNGTAGGDAPGVDGDVARLVDGGRPGEEDAPAREAYDEGVPNVMSNATRESEHTHAHAHAHLRGDDGEMFAAAAHAVPAPFAASAIADEDL